MAHRYYSQSITESNILLVDDEAHHVAKVMRGKIGDSLTVFDGKGYDYNCIISEINADNVSLEIVTKCKNVSEPSILVNLFVGYPKADKLEFIIQKATELGAVKIIPFFSRYCVVAPKNEDKKNQRYNRIAFEAAKQCGRGIIPIVEMPVSYTQMIKMAAECDTSLFCYEAGGAPLHSRLENAKTIAIITGAEGGFSQEEALAAQNAGLATIGLGSRILRCETAPIAALSAVMALSGNLQ